MTATTSHNESSKGVDTVDALSDEARLARLEGEVGELKQRVAAALETVRSLPLPASAGMDVAVSEVTA